MRRVVCIVVAFLLPVSVFGAPYADLVFTVDGDHVKVTGDTNANISDNTSSYLDDQTFSFTTNQSFSDYIITVRLPQTADITDIQTSGTQRISTEDGYIVITSVGTDQPINITIVYDDNQGSTSRGLIGGVVTAAILLAGLITYYFILGDDAYVVPDDVSDRQERILRFVADNQPVTQQAIADRLALPKSSVSRNVSSLTKQGYLESDDVGNAKQIRIA